MTAFRYVWGLCAKLPTGLALFILCIQSLQAATFIARGSSWSYLDNGSDQGTAWQGPSFDDSSWQTGAAQLGYGDGDESTVVGFGSDSSRKHVTTYYRNSFEVSDPAQVHDLSLDLQRDDGAIVYINGIEVVRSNMPGGSVNSDTFASSAVGGSSESAFSSFDVNPSLLVAGINTVAVEIHQIGFSSSDTSFDLGLTYTESSGSELQAGSYLNADSSWRYLDDGSNQGTAWQTVGFDDGGWSTGSAQLGYGDGDESTVVSFGSNSSNKFITTWFRKNFDITDASRIVDIAVNLLADDGAVVYVNGIEVVRSNMPAGDINYNTQAVNTIGGGAESRYTSFALDSNLLQTGSNLIAVEVHQKSASSSDLSFNLSITGSETSLPPETEAPNVPESLIGLAVDSTRINLFWDASTDNGGGSVSGYKIYRDSSPIAIATVATTSYADIGLAESTEYRYTVSAYDNANPANESLQSEAFIVSTSAPDPSAPIAVDYLGAGSSWRYLDDGSDQGVAWRTLGFNDGSWLSGSGQLGYGDGDESTIVDFGPSSSNKYITTWFRQNFTVLDASRVIDTTIHLLADDGAIVYVNGTEVVRSNMPAGAINSSTLASSTVGGGAESRYTNYVLDPAVLVTGTNLIAVEVHQKSVGSSDISFDLSLSGTAYPGTSGEPVAVPLLTGFDTVDEVLWDDTAVRKVLHTFAFGGQALDAQIATWGAMRPDLAIVQMLTFEEHNLLLSPVGPQDYDRLDTRPGTLRGVGDFWSSSDPGNGVAPAARYTFINSSTVGVPSNTWMQAALSRGLNPFRQKVGLWETNDHLVAHRDHARKHQVIRHYDAIMSALALGKPYQDVLTEAATSAAIASQYGHRRSVYVDGECKCNEDFAREYFQLFFGILGEDNPSYHELTTIKNMAKVLTDMSDTADGTSILDTLIIGSERHFQGDLEMLNVTIGGSNALERIEELSDYAIEHPESLKALPVKIIEGLADDNMDADKIARVRSAWASMPEKNLLDFLRAYAISTLFHNENRVKYLSSIDRNMRLLNGITLTNEDNYLGVYGMNVYEKEDVQVFEPRHNVFGGQTGREAAESADVFLTNYNTITKIGQRLNVVTKERQGRSWEKDWAAVVSPSADGNYVIREVAEWLWNRFIGDGLKNFGLLERAHVYALLATQLDIAYLADIEDPDRIITTADLQVSPLIELVEDDLANRVLRLDDVDDVQRQLANRRMGQAINFIAGMPFIFAEEGR